MCLASSVCFRQISKTEVFLCAHCQVTAAEWYVRFHDWNSHYLVGGSKWNCTVKHERPGLIVRRLTETTEAGQFLNLRAAEARYDEIYQDADISFRTDGACGASAVESSLRKDKMVCIGYNTDCSGSADATIPIYTSKYIGLTCSDCFADFTMDVFIELRIRGWEVANVSAGFRRVAINTSTVMDAKASANWGAAADKVLPVLQNQYLVDFKVGVVPFMIFFDLPVELKADLSFSSAAEVTAGAHVNLDIGDAYVSWDPSRHWTHTLPQVTLATTPIFTSTGSVDAQGTLSAVPMLTAHFDKVLSYQLTANPELDLSITGSEQSKQVCLDSTYSVALTSVTKLDINIPWANIAKDWIWTKDIYSSGAQQLTHKCVAV